MAIYQLQLFAIPRIGVLEKFGLIPERLEIDYKERKAHYQLRKEDLLEDEDVFKDALTQDWWHSTDLQPVEVIHQIDKRIRRANYGDDTWVVWKNYSQDVDNDASMLINDETGKIQELQFRADLREDNLKFLRAMIDLAQVYDWLLMDFNGNLANPEMKTILGWIKNSNAFKFLQDPVLFLSELSSHPSDH
jgi:hypothetical protein